MAERVYAYDDATAIQERMARMAANRLKCCFSKSGLNNASVSSDIACWCYARDDDGKDVSINCVSRKLVIHEGAIGDARFSFEETAAS